MDHKRLQRLETFLDAAYAMVVINFFLDYLPPAEDMAWIELPYGLLSLLLQDPQNLLRLFIGLGLTIISWNLTHKLLGALEQSNLVHTLLCVLQFIFVCLFLWFAISDPEIITASSRVGQSLCLAISGFIGVAGWFYARNKGYAKADLTEDQKDSVEKNIFTEPVTALLNTGPGFVGPITWTLGWVLIPLVLAGGKRLWKRGAGNAPA